MHRTCMDSANGNIQIETPIHTVQRIQYMTKLSVPEHTHPSNNHTNQKQKHPLKRRLRAKKSRGKQDSIQIDDRRRFQH